MSEAHMLENLAYFDITLTDAEMAALSSRPQDPCASDPKWYECWNSTTTAAAAASKPPASVQLLRGSAAAY
jgi:hypothetical protein